MHGFKGMGEDFEDGSEFDREPVELLENGGNVVKRGGSSDDAGCWVLDRLKFMKVFMGDTKRKWVAVIKTGGDEAVNQEGSGVTGEKEAKAINVS